MIHCANSIRQEKRSALILNTYSPDSVKALQCRFCLPCSDSLWRYVKKCLLQSSSPWFPSLFHVFLVLFNRIIIQSMSQVRQKGVPSMCQPLNLYHKKPDIQAPKTCFQSQSEDATTEYFGNWLIWCLFLKLIGFGRFWLIIQLRKFDKLLELRNTITLAFSLTSSLVSQIDMKRFSPI